MNSNEQLKKAKYGCNYGQNVCTMGESGTVCYSPDSQKDVVGANNMTYDEYLDVQIQSLGKTRSGFEACYYNIPLEFKGEIKRFSKRGICFKRIFISAMYPDGGMFDDKEDHVWMDKAGFEKFSVGDCLSFGAEVYRYVKTGHGKMIDYSLRNPEGIQKVPSYELPTDDELRAQAIQEIICETCFLSEHCNKVSCILKSHKKRHSKSKTSD